MSHKSSADATAKSHQAHGQHGAHGQTPSHGHAASQQHAPRNARPAHKPVAPWHRRWGPGIKYAMYAGVGVLLLAVLFVLNNSAKPATGHGGAGQIPFAVGNPGPGAAAPAMTLASTAGGSFDLGAARDKTVLLYFHEGLGCEPCWTQLKDIQKDTSPLKQLGIDEIVSITTNPLSAIKQKVADEGISIPVLSDPDMAVSKAYGANQYGMMGASADGHTFILVGPDGRIRWRADYGGPPQYTMYVPISNLVADIREGLHATS